VLGVVVAGSTPAAGIALIAVAAIVFVAAAILSSTLNVIFRVALYRFATEQRVVGGFDADALAGAFQSKKRGRRQPAI
jgi:type II secretory pathway component PulK